jgi:hypothetical protein
VKALRVAARTGIWHQCLRVRGKSSALEIDAHEPAEIEHGVAGARRTQRVIERAAKAFGKCGEHRVVDLVATDSDVWTNHGHDVREIASVASQLPNTRSHHALR